MDWEKETRCTPCRIPTVSIKNIPMLRYIPVTCRTCKYANISKCSECAEEIRHCTYRGFYNSPPSVDIDKKRKCVWYDEV